MKRDWNLTRAILLAVEDQTGTGLPNVEGYNREEVGYHAHLLNEMGLAKGFSVRNTGHRDPYDFISNLTLPGHDFVESVRDESRWNAALAEAERRGSVTFAVLN